MGKDRCHQTLVAACDGCGILDLFEDECPSTDTWSGLRAKFIELRPGLVAGLSTGSGRGELRASGLNHSPFVHFTCLLQDTSQAHVRGQTLTPCVGDGHVVFAPGERFSARYGANFRHVDLMVAPETLAELAGEEFERIESALHGGFVMQNTRLGHGNMGVAAKLARRIGEDETQRLYLYGAALEYLGAHFSALKSDGDDEALSERECKRLIAARERLLQDLSAPPTIAELAREIGLNQLKLKRGFRALFGTSIYALFQQYRMERARILLRKHSVTETALMLGYSNLSHFSAAFRKQFGILPRDERRGSTV